MPPKAPEIRLEPFTLGDIPRLIAWIDSPEALLQWAGPGYRFPLTQAQVMDDLAAAAGPTPTCYPFRIATASGEVVGHIELRAIDFCHNNARIGRVLVGDPTWRSRGVAAQALAQVIAQAFEPLALHRLELAVYDFNHAAIACYEKLGFRQEGLRREAARVGESYWNCITMGLLARDWKATSKGQKSLTK